MWLGGWKCVQGGVKKGDIGIGPETILKTKMMIEKNKNNKNKKRKEK